MKSADMPDVTRGVSRLAASLISAGLLVVLPVVVAHALARFLAAWVVMAAIAAATFLTLKVMTLAGNRAAAAGWRGWAYVVAWPGLNARAFLSRNKAPRNAPWRELGAALGKLALGAGLVFWATVHAGTGPVWRVGWVGMVGIIFTLHFGVMHVASWIWRRLGFHAPPIMNAPLLAVSLAEFWSERWNVAFADVARRFVFRPLARRWGALRAGGVVFLVSGVVHELVISLPARGGWGGPTAYFALQAAGVAIERTRIGKAAGLGRGFRGWLCVFFFTVPPLPLLFHGPFVGKVIVPMFNDFSLLLP